MVQHLVGDRFGHIRLLLEYNYRTLGLLEARIWSTDCEGGTPPEILPAVQVFPPSRSITFSAGKVETADFQL